MHPANYWISTDINEVMDLHIFKTDIRTRQKLKLVEPILNNHPVIDDWSIDTDDIDNVLRIEVNEKIDEGEIVKLVQTYGFQCEPLED